MAIRLRRPLALASVVTATLACAVVLRSVLDDGGDAGPPAASPSPSASQASTPNPSPTAQPALTEVSPLLAKRVFAAGESVTVKDGLGFLSAADGSLETWSLPTAADSYYYLDSTPDAALLVLNEGKEGSPNYVIERASGRTWRLANGLSPLVAAAHGSLLVLSIHQGAADSSAVLNVLDGTLKPLDSLLPTGNAMTSPDGRKVLVQSSTAVYLVELATARTQKVRDGLVQDQDNVRALPGALGFSVGRPDQPTARWFDWEGAENLGGIGSGEVSPNGKYLATGWSPGPVKAMGMGGYPSVDAVVIYDRKSNVPLAQLLSATAGGWTSASDGLLVQVSTGYRLVSPAGQTLSTIDDPIHVLDPRPSPTIAGLLGTNRGTIINTSRNQTVAPKYAVDPWHAGWTTRPGELVVTLATPGKGRSWPDEVLPYETRAAGSRIPPAAVVKTGGDCLNLREKPDAAAAVLRCLPDGTLANFEAVDDPNPDPKSSGSGETPRKYAGYESTDLTVWLHLKLADGAAGWADAKYLRWAN